MIDWLTDTTLWTFRNSLETCVLILLVAGISMFGRRSLSPKFRALLWVVVGLRLVLPWAPESAVSIFNLMPAVAESVASTEVVAIEPIVVAEPSVPVEVAPPLDLSTKAAPTPLPLSFWLGLLWAMGVVGVFGVVLVQQIRARRRVGALMEVQDPRVLAIFSEITDGSEYGQRLHLVESPRKGEIAIFGFFKPSRVIVPSGFADDYTEQEIRSIFLHEIAHVKRGDLLWNWATLLVQALHWFNPLVWWAGRQFLAERELLCDEMALGALPESEREHYGAALMKTLHLGNAVVSPNPAFVPFFSRKSELKHRLIMITKPHQFRLLLQGVALLTAVVACAVTFTSAVADEKRATEQLRGGGKEGPRRSSERAEGAARDASKRITVTEEGVIIGGRAMDLPTFRRGLDGIKGEPVVLYGAKDLPYQYMVTVMNDLRDAGVTKIAFVAGEAPAGDSPEGRAPGRRDGEGVKPGPRDEGRRSLEAGRDRPMPAEGRAPGRRDGEGAKPGPRDEGRRAPEAGRDRPMPAEGRAPGRGDGEGAKPGPRDEGRRSPEAGRDRPMPAEGRAPGRGDGEGAKPGPRDEGRRAPEAGRDRPMPAEGRAPGRRDGEGVKPGPRDEGRRSPEAGRDRPMPEGREGLRPVGPERGAAPAVGNVDQKKVGQLDRIYKVWDKDGDNAITFVEWLSMKDGEMTRDRRKREEAWFEQADVDADEKVTREEWIAWKLAQEQPRRR